MPEEHSRMSVTRQGDRVVIKNGHFRVDYDLANGTWDYIDLTGYKVIRNAYSKMILEDGKTITTMDDAKREFMTESVTDDIMGKCKSIKFSHKINSENLSINLYMKVHDELPYLLINSELHNHSREGKIARIEPITISPIYGEKAGGVYLGKDPDSCNVYLNTDARIARGMYDVYNGFDFSKMVVSGNQYDGLVYDSETKRSLAFGFLDMKKWYSKIELGYDSELQLLDKYDGINKWALFHEYENCVCRENSKISTGCVYLNFSSSAGRAQELYASLISESLNLPLSGKNISRWTPHHYSDRVNAKYIAEHAEWIAEHKTVHEDLPSLPEIEYVIVSMGWQKWLGTNDVNFEAFSGGMRELVEKIHQKGLKAGLWIAPFWVAREAPLVQERPDYILHDGNNKMIEVVDPHIDSKAFLLDPSHSGVREYINRRIREIASDWGFDLIEVDLISHSSDADIDVDKAVSYNKSMTSVELLNSGLSFLNEITDRYDVKLIPHCTSYGFSPGTVFSSDIGTQCSCYQGINLWDEKNGVKELVSKWASRYYLHEKLFTDDLGPLFIEERPLNEALIIATAAALSGRGINVSDNLMDMSPERLEILSRVLPSYNKIAEPIDRYDHRYPRIWKIEIERDFEKWDLLALFNWDDVDDEISFMLNQVGLDQAKSYIVYDFWEEEYIGEFTENITLYNLPPHSMKLLCVRERQEVPQIMSTNIHYTQGGIEIISSGWDERSQTLLGVCKTSNSPKGKIFIYVPNGFVPAYTACYGAEYSFNWQSPIHSIEMKPFNEVVNFSINFGKTSG